nr:FG-GAP-like repeat-containing protein [Rhodopirellula sallentina]
MLVYRSQIVWGIVGAALSLCAQFGCSRTDESMPAERKLGPIPVDSQIDPLQRLRLAVERERWQEAWEGSNAALTQHPDDAEVIYLVANVAQKVGKPDVAAELVMDACRAENFQDVAGIKRAMEALLKVGRLYDCLDLFEDALEVDPNLHEIRQYFYDMCWGAEDRRRAIPHGRLLVKYRQFDLPLLLTLSSTESGTDRLESFVAMAKRHPRDKRPLVAEAKYRFDQGEFTRAEATLRQVLETHPEHLPANALLCRVLIAKAAYDEFAKLPVELSDGIDGYPDYWLAVGDWCWYAGRQPEAARAYWEAARRDADGREYWLKLATSLRQLDHETHGIDDLTLSSVENRVRLLTLFSDATTRFRTYPSQAVAVEIAEALQNLGRLWEAEAWAAIATRLPRDPAVPVAQIRESIVCSLRKDTPWQIDEKHPELRIDLSHLVVPRLDSLGRIADQRDQKQMRICRRSERLRLKNEANERSLTFFGRTADDLDRPGVMHYQTLGCGGGAIDYNLDGWPDLYFAAAGGTPPNRDSSPNALWINRGGTFVDVSRESGTDDTGFGQGVAVGDVNEDGFPDLLILNYGPNVLFINNGDGTFTDASERLPSEGQEVVWSSSGAIADWNQDGLADLTILNYGKGLEPVTKKCFGTSKSLARACAPLNFKAAADRFCLNSQTGEFADQASLQPTASNLGRGLGVIAGDLDQVPGVDLFVANDQSSNHYWSRSESKEYSLKESAIVRGLGASNDSPYQGSMGLATGDFDRDGDFDLFVTNFHQECNTYHDQLSPGGWRDQTMPQRLYSATLPMVGFGSQAVDLDNDGWLELIVTNGHVDRYPGEKSGSYAQPMQVFRRNTVDDYESIAELIDGEYISATHVGRALWTVDANRDGRTDLVITHQTEPVALLVNQTEESGDWIGLQLVGRDCSRDAIGAVVEIESNDRRWVVPLTSGDGYLCSNERILRVGLGESAGECDVVVKWACGTQQRYPGLKPNVTWLCVEADHDAYDLSTDQNVATTQ